MARLTSEDPLRSPVKALADMSNRVAAETDDFIEELSAGARTDPESFRGLVRDIIRSGPEEFLAKIEEPLGTAAEQLIDDLIAKAHDDPEAFRKELEEMLRSREHEAES